MFQFVSEIAKKRSAGEGGVTGGPNISLSSWEGDDRDISNIWHPLPSGNHLYIILHEQIEGRQHLSTQLTQYISTESDLQFASADTQLSTANYNVRYIHLWISLLQT
jgi:hypothetical protein